MAAKVDKKTIKLRIQPNTQNTLLATWAWTKSHTDKYEYKWQYNASYYNKKTKKWETNWLEGSSSSTNLKNCTYTIPSEATQVRFSVKPISKTHKVKKKDKAYWTAGWSSWVVYKVTNLAPSVPSAPNVSLNSNNTKIIAYVDIDMSGSSVNRATKIEFALHNIADDAGEDVLTKTVNVAATGRATTSFDLTNGVKYRVRCRAIDAQGNKSNFTSYTPYPDFITALPSAPTALNVVLKNINNDQKTVEATWKKGSGTVDSYELQYTTNKDYFDKTSYVKSETPTTTGWIFDLNEDNNLYGNIWYFRVRAVNTTGNSAWSNIFSLTVGTEPEAPTTWSLNSTVIVGEDNVLYWTHNTVDGSKEESAKLQLTVNGVDQTVITIPKTDDEPISQYILNTSSYPNGATINWKVKTKGIYSGGTDGGYGKWSATRTINVVARPTLDVAISNDSNWYWDFLNFNNSNIYSTEGDLGSSIDAITRYPFFISALAGPNNQNVLRWYVSIISKESYQAFDLDSASPKTVNEGDQVYSKFFDNDGDNRLFLSLFPTDVALENGVDYTILVRVVMDSGLSVEVEKDLSVSLDDDIYDISAAININDDIAAAYITPYVTYVVYYGTVVNDSGTLKFQIESDAEGENLISFDDTTGLSEGDEVSVHIIDNVASVVTDEDEEEHLDDVYFSIYRINFDGTFTEIESKIDSYLDATIIDYHPALDFARYRIVAISKLTGNVIYEDFFEEVGDNDIIIQWNNKTLESFIVNDNDNIEEYPEISGEFLRLPWNIDTSESHSKDNALVEYIGREHPVSYYGTQLGETATWNTDVDKEDTDTIYALRRLAIYQGDVYAREPSGVGYWAQIQVSFNNTHEELVIPVTLTLTRVEGGA